MTAVTARRRSDWPDARIAALKALFDEGLSHELIARKMGIGKGAVSAKIDRLGWTRSATVVALRPDRSVTIAQAEARRARAKAVIDAEQAEVGLKMLELVDQHTSRGTWTACRWPLALHEGQRTFCGSRSFTHIGDRPSSYCEHHGRRSIAR